MKKRLRKKKHLGEFDCIGFNLEAEFCELTNTEFDALHDAFLDYIESIGLCCGGGMGKHWNLFINREDDKPVTWAEHDKVIVWLMKSGVKHTNTLFESGWHCRPLTKSELHKFKLTPRQ